MKLYYTPGACSQVVHIVAREAGFAIDLAPVDLRTKKTADGRDFASINPKGYVPALELDDGQILTEVSALMQYLADQKPASGLLPAIGAMKRYRILELVGYISTELHKSFGPLFNPKTSPEVREERVAYIARRFGLLDALLAKQPYLTGDAFSIADAYLFVMLNWAGMMKLDMAAFPALAAFRDRVAARPAVVDTLKAEGFIK